MRVALVTNQLSLRGTEVVLGAYARHARRLWRWDVVFIVRHESSKRPNTPDCTDASYALYENEFDVVYSGSDAAIEWWCEATGVDVAVVEVSGYPGESWMPRTVPTIAHCVFTTAFPLECSVHAAVSASVAGPGVALLPNIVETLPDAAGDMRESLGIPRDAVVFGRHGGYDTFDIEWVFGVVRRVASRTPHTPHIHFVFMNTAPFYAGPNVTYLEATTDPATKTAFIDTCDAMLHARTVGETFGLSVAEFAQRGKPVITHAVARDKEHLRLLGDAAITYKDARELETVLTTFTKQSAQSRQSTGYAAFTPELVMPIFRDLVEKAVSRGPPLGPGRT